MMRNKKEKRTNNNEMHMRIDTKIFHQTITHIEVIYAEGMFMKNI